MGGASGSRAAATRLASVCFDFQPCCCHEELLTCVCARERAMLQELNSPCKPVHRPESNSKTHMAHTRQREVHRYRCLMFSLSQRLYQAWNTRRMIPDSAKYTQAPQQTCSAPHTLPPVCIHVCQSRRARACLCTLACDLHELPLSSNHDRKAFSCDLTDDLTDLTRALKGKPFALLRQLLARPFTLLRKVLRCLQL
jgi:hypothetical protein